MRAADGETDLLLDLLAKLVRAPSINPPGNECLAADVLVEHLAQAGLAAEVSEFAAGRANVVAHAGDPTQGPTIALCSHLDVVPPGAGWITDPFALQEREGMLIGRGVCDAKGPLAAMVRAFCRLAAPGEGRASGEVVLAAVGGEENGALGAKALVASGLRPDAVVIGEPTSMRVCTAHMGRAEFDIHIDGLGGHAAAVRSLDSPVTRVAEVIRRLVDLGETIGRRHHPLLGVPTLAITRVEAVGVTATSVPGEARLLVDRRLVPGEDHESVGAEVDAALDGIPGLTCSARHGALPCEQPLGDQLVASANEALGAEVDAVFGFGATCDQYVFAGVGASTVVLGPGDLQANRAHAPNETVSLTDLVRASEIYERLVRGYLAERQGAGRGP